MRSAASAPLTFLVTGALLGGCASTARTAKTASPTPAEPYSAIAVVPGIVPTPLGELASAPAVVVRAAPPLAPAPLGQTAAPVAVVSPLVKVALEGELNPCGVRGPEEEQPVDAAQRKLYETLCGASLWFDGLFGERRNITAARQASGRLELSVLESQYEGIKVKPRGTVRVDFPNLDRRVHAFLGRDDQDDFIRDRTEGLALRSQFINVETNEGWLAGLGYGLPGSYRQRTDFRVGGKLGSEPKIFAQGRHRRNWVRDRQNLWHLRETVFWTNRDGFGSTTGLDYDHIFRRSMLFRWANVGTVSEETKGFEWRTALLLYQDLPGHRAMAYEAFLRGWSKGEVGIREYGTRVIYRQSILGREWLSGEAVLGYSWPREKRLEKREGSLTYGLGVEMRFGRNDYD